MSLDEAKVKEDEMKKVEVPNLEELVQECAREWGVWQGWLDEFHEQTSPTIVIPNCNIQALKRGELE